MTPFLIANLHSPRTPIETVAALIALSAHRKQLTRWVVPKKDVVDLLRKYTRLSKRVRLTGFSNNLLVFMNEYDIAMFEIDRDTWGFVRHERTKSWRRLGWSALTDAELHKPDVYALEAEFGYSEAADTVLDEDGEIDKVATLAKLDFAKVKLRFCNLTQDFREIVELGDLLHSKEYAQAQIAEDVAAIQLLVKRAEQIILSPRTYSKHDTAQQFMCRINLLLAHFSNNEGLIRDAEGNRCEVTERHIAEQKWDMFMPNELMLIHEHLKRKLVVRYEV